MLNDNCLIYIRDNKWHVEDRNRRRVAGSPCDTLADAERVARNHAGCLATVAESKRTTIRDYGYSFDPSE